MLKIGNSEILKIYAGNTEITKAFLGAEQVYPDSTPPTPTDFSGLTFEIQSAGNIVLYTNGNFEGKQIQYSKNGGAWTNAQFEQYGYTITVVSGDTLQFRGNNDCYFESGHVNYFGGTASFKANGNIMSLINYNYDNLLGFTKNDCLMDLFRNCYGLTDASELILPATALTKGCYSGMFEGCSGLTSAPALPATTLAVECYISMFRNCTSLASAPDLPATTLVNKCYWSMFSGCSSLSAITCLAEDISATGCTNAWVSGVSQTGYFSGSTLAGWTLDSVNGVPIGWSSNLNDVYKSMPLTFEIQGNGKIEWVAQYNNTKTIQYSKNGGAWTTITSSSSNPPSINVVSGDTVQFKGDNSRYYNRYFNCFRSNCNFKLKGNIMSLVNSTTFSALTSFTDQYVFDELFYYSVTNITDITNLVMPATTLTAGCYQNLFAGARFTSIPSGLLPATTLAVYCYQGMFRGCIYLTTAPELPATGLTEGCYYSMFQNCYSLTSVPNLPATTLAPSCYSQMFDGCTSLTTVPELPATSLYEACYYEMFNGCTSLTAITCLAENIYASDCTKDWVDGVASAGTFSGSTLAGWTIGNSGIPVGWTSNLELISAAASVKFNKTPANKDISIAATADWEIVSYPNWLHFTGATSGTPSVTSVTAYPDDNDTGDDRSGTTVFRLINNTSVTAETVINQSAQDGGVLTDFADWFNSLNDLPDELKRCVPLGEVMYIKDGWSTWRDCDIANKPYSCYNNAFYPDWVCNEDPDYPTYAVRVSGYDMVNYYDSENCYGEGMSSTDTVEIGGETYYKYEFGQDMFMAGDDTDEWSEVAQNQGYIYIEPSSTTPVACDGSPIEF